MEIRPIKTESDYEAALARLEAIWDPEPDTPEADEFELLAMLIDAYEQRHFPISPPDPIEAIKFRMDQMGFSRKDLEPFIGSRGRVSEVLNGKRDLTLEMIRRLHAGLNIPFESLISGNDRPGLRGI
jgi:HTH-type transcriptional regulator/antitoxin HigA